MAVEFMADQIHFLRIVGFIAIELIARHSSNSHSNCLLSLEKVAE